MKRLTVDNFQDQILESPRPCLILFKRDSCHLCSGLVPVLFRINKRYGNRLKTGYIDADVEEGLAEIFSISGVPTVYFSFKGDAVEVEYPESPSPFSGYTEEDLVNYLENFFSK